jgi:hypothetical protein
LDLFLLLRKISKIADHQAILDSGVSASSFESVQSLQKGMKQEHIQGSSMSHSRRFGLLLPGSPTVTPVGQWSPTRCTPAVVSSR